MAQNLNPDQIRALIEQKKREIEQRKQMVAGVATPTPAGMQAGARTPLPGGAQTPLPTGAHTPMPAGLRTPMPHGVATPLPGGITTPAPHGMPGGVTTPLPAGVQTPKPLLPLPNGQLGDLQAKVKEQLASLQKRAADEGVKKPRSIMMDASGRMVDASGNVIHMERRVPELSVNKRAKKREELTKMVEAQQEEDIADNPYYDERLEMKPKERKRRAFRFKEKGYYLDQADRERAKAKLEKLQAEIASAAQKTGISKMAVVAPKKEELEVSSVPDVEWWDQVILNGGYEKLDSGDPEFNDITNLVQHPITFEPQDANKVVATPVYLTKKEQKKMRRQRRRAENEEKTEKIRLGQMEAPAPKVKISNLMRVLGTEAVADPTKVEAIVKAQMDLRQKQHKEHNEAMQLSKEERSAKKAAKLKEDTTEAVHVALFRVGSLRDERHKFKVQMNAQQYNLTGAAVMTADMNIVVVEGGPRGIKRYKRLMTHRIKWAGQDAADDESEEEEEGEETKKRNSCDLVWEGLVTKRNFKDFGMKLFRSETLAREWLDKKNAAHYWDLCFSEAAAPQE
ncbi:hypothetical protein PTSG_12874 [Salpingoeca rosetta]|uniref:Uncharacterized protein n=1 Tax=Salpingoeca rosetta (strain ATCC 50818 / BSB-021) TaxID=946362 RepID=F2UMD6_SALR5|nr:uncharacterized protein PTSG_12874 [Salpingoeca rosetta]EGD78285.1 hypothetical protein PTSG_12874 [Salpingoeca rosetta]|eukprot:XP_004989608.1 hypothetical protein PTSG_12874 [Salpingoeca rosetta]